MKKTKFTWGVLAITLTLAMALAGCGDPEGGPTGGNPTVPGAVANFTATPGDTQVELSWSAPSDNGGSAITGYEVTRDNWTNKETKTASQTTHTYTGLTNGTQYTFKVRALNAQGAGAESVTGKVSSEQSREKSLLCLLFSVFRNKPPSGLYKF